MSFSIDYLFIFQLPNDMENYMQYHLMGSVAQVRMNPGCLPKKFACQPDRKTRITDPTTERPYMRKKRRILAIEECEKQLKEATSTTASLDVEQIVLGSSGKYVFNIYVN